MAHKIRQQTTRDRPDRPPAVSSTHSTSHTAPLPLFRPLRVKHTPFITRMHSQTDSTKRMMPKRLPIRNSFPPFSPSLEDPGIFPMQWRCHILGRRVSYRPIVTVAAPAKQAHIKHYLHRRDIESANLPTSTRKNQGKGYCVSYWLLAFVSAPRIDFCTVYSANIFISVGTVVSVPFGQSLQMTCRDHPN